MQNVLLHIGYPKTATTWFVRNFYPGIGNAFSFFHDDIVYDLSSGLFEIKNISNGDKNKLRIICSHALSGFVDFQWADGVYRNFFLEKLKKNFPDAIIILFIRNQLDFISSGYSTYLTHGGTYKFAKLFKPALIDGKMFPLEYLNYYETIKSLRRHFIPDHVHVYLYEEFLENNTGFLTHYKEKYALDIDLGSVSFLKENEKLRKRLLSFIRFANKWSKNGASPKNYYLDLPFTRCWMKKNIDTLNQYRIWGRRQDPSEVIGKEQESILTEYFKHSNALLVNEYGMDAIKKFNYPL